MKLESSITYITGYSGFIARVLFLIAWGADTHTSTHTHTHAYIRTEVILRNQAHAWFNNIAFELYRSNKPPNSTIM